VAVDGRFPEARGVLWPPTGPGVGDAAAVEDGVALGDTVGVGGPDCAPDDDGETAADGDALCAPGVVGIVEAGDALADVGDGLAPVSPAAGLRAIAPVDDAATTAAPSATRPRIATIGTTPIRLPMGNRSRQLGQNPDTGVVTYPQFRQRTGRRFRAMAWLAAFSMRDPF